ncbi:MAG: Tyrosine type site-specific recombinase [Chitinophagaceae bacterium]|nr:Tyrosine type site-specific recombinase [Chitinophagaceae bacterium]
MENKLAVSFKGYKLCIDFNGLSRTKLFKSQLPQPLWQKLLHCFIIRKYRELLVKGKVECSVLFYSVFDEPGGQTKLSQLVELHFGHIQKRCGLDFAKGTVERYRQTRLVLKQYLSLTKLDHIELRYLDVGFIEAFKQYILKIRRNSINTCDGHCRNLKWIIHFAVKNGWLEHSPFFKFKGQQIKGTTSCLSLAEFGLLAKTRFSNHVHNFVKQMFLLQCYTGLSYSDLLHLKQGHLFTGVDGNQWIILFRRKTSNRTSVPLLPKALKIIQTSGSWEIKSKPRVPGALFPMHSLTMYNLLLLKIMSACGINKKISSHSGRKTFASSFALKYGASIEGISKMLGHSTITYTQLYTEVSDTKVAREMKGLQNNYLRLK